MTEENIKTEEKEGVQVYELGYHMLSTLTEDELASALDAIRAELSKEGAEFISEGAPELIELAYEMIVNNGGKHTKYDKAYFGWIKFVLDTSKTENLRHEVLDADKNILRYILIKTVREDTRIQNLADASVLEEVETKGTLEQKTEDESTLEELSEEDLDKAVEELVEDTETGAVAKTEDVVLDDASEADDLTKIEGIGPVIAKTLAEAGIKTFAQLADARDEDVQEIIKDVRGNHDAGTWNEQAALARDGAWDELKELQGELLGGVASK